MSNNTVGRYQLIGEIGRGNMATVYRAFDPNSNREVAVKILPHEMMHNREFRARFRQEITMIASLEHPAIVPVYDSGEENGQPYFVMRYMTGGSLSRLLEGGKLSLINTAEIIEKLALGLDYAHQKGIIHRDLKPDNVLFDANNNPYLSDFGVAKLVEAAFSETGSGIVGTPAYVSPEQAGGENDKVDHRSDVYGLGVLVYQMLTGKQPFAADTAMGVLVKHINDPVPNILDANPDLPPPLETIIKTAMAKKKEDRYESVLEFARALSIAAFGPERTVPSALALERRRLSSLSSRRRTAYILFGGMLVIAISGLSYFLPNIMSHPTPVTVNTVSSTPSLTLTATAVPSEKSTPTISPPTETSTSTQEIPTLIPTPNGGADQIALLSGNDILSMSLDGASLISIDNENYEKSNLQWITDGRLVYISPSRNCAYLVDVEKNEGSSEIICFDLVEKLEGFRVSPNGLYVAISVDGVLYIVPFDVEQLKRIYTRFLLDKMENSCSYNVPVKDVRWSRDGSRIAALVADTQQGLSDQIHLFNVSPGNCNSQTLVAIDKFPATRFTFSSTTIESYDWDGGHLFLLNDNKRNGGFGDLYLYDSESHVGLLINPIDGSCCYRDARWSPDGGYVLFLYQNVLGSEIKLYYIPTDALAANETWTPIEILPDLFKPRDNPQPALRPVQ